MAYSPYVSAYSFDMHPHQFPAISMSALWPSASHYRSTFLHRSVSLACSQPPLPVTFYAHPTTHISFTAITTQTSSKKRALHYNLISRVAIIDVFLLSQPTPMTFSYAPTALHYSRLTVNSSITSATSEVGIEQRSNLSQLLFVLCIEHLRTQIFRRARLPVLGRIYTL